MGIYSGELLHRMPQARTDWTARAGSRAGAGAGSGRRCWAGSWCRGARTAPGDGGAWQMILFVRDQDENLLGRWATGCGLR